MNIGLAATILHKQDISNQGNASLYEFIFF